MNQTRSDIPTFAKNYWNWITTKIVWPSDKTHHRNVLCRLYCSYRCITILFAFIYYYDYHFCICIVNSNCPIRIFGKTNFIWVVPTCPAVGRLVEFIHKHIMPNLSDWVRLRTLRTKHKWNQGCSCSNHFPSPKKWLQLRNVDNHAPGKWQGQGKYSGQQVGTKKWQ